jgi:hypothetical protein
VRTPEQKHPRDLVANKYRGNGRELTAVVRVPTNSLTAATVVTHVYPTADLVPENLLKFYVHFSAPMSRGHIYDYLRLLKEDGKQVELPFLEIDEELWDDTMTRLTIFIDPGRIKRGVLPLEDVGPALEAGKRYTLVIDRAWNDGAGKPLKESQHQLVVQTTIEDLAGNNIGKPFDVDLFEGVQRRLTTSTVKLPLPIQ